MITVKEAQATTVYFIDSETKMVKSTDLYDYVTSFENRDYYRFAKYEEELNGWYVHVQRANRSPIRGEVSFDTEEEADDEIFNLIYNYDYCESNDCCYYTQEEAEASIILDISEDYAIDIHVAKSIYHKMKVVAAKKAERNEQRRVDVERIATEIAVLVPIEAAAITIDDQFKSDLISAAYCKGKEKSDRMTIAMKGLLQRNNIAEIKSDFWKVFRFLKAKAETM